MKTETTAKLLVVDDDDAIRDLLASYLRQVNFEVAMASDGHEALELFVTQPFSLVVLDVAMPGLDGWGVLSEIRKISDTPVLMLTARVQEKDQLTGFGLGADDYVTKPFSLRQVVARVEAILRRSGVSQSKTMSVGPVELNPVSHEVTLNGKRLDLTGREYALLEVLLRYPDRIFSRTELLSRCWEPGFDGVDRVVDVHMASLRRKLGRRRSMIMTVRGAGYKISAI